MKEKLATIPNAITLCRIILVPFFISALVRNRVELAVLLFGAIALSDALDGLSARITKQKTRIGALLDSTTDWLVILSTLITFLVIRKYIPFKLIIILLIPMAVSYVAKSIYIKKKKKTAPTVIGKISVAFAYVTTIVILIDFAYQQLFLIIMTLLAYSTMINYMIKDAKLFIR
ncbi:CDP-alcohol phosphatidyltransferase family protein [Candidatus Woesearchaeota archaeon]|nr:CDP-alcohol phosphatidyltransferase family protein [Candidatus Woesearchaeota archaeon]